MAWRHWAVTLASDFLVGGVSFVWCTCRDRGWLGTVPMITVPFEQPSWVSLPVGRLVRGGQYDARLTLAAWQKLTTTGSGLTCTLRTNKLVRLSNQSQQPTGVVSSTMNPDSHST